MNLEEIKDLIKIGKLLIKYFINHGFIIIIIIK
jgi:hypothetical protein